MKFQEIFTYTFLSKSNPLKCHKNKRRFNNVRMKVRLKNHEQYKTYV